MDRADVVGWIAGYEEAWRSPGTVRLGALFTEDATYLPSPWSRPRHGLAAIAELWEAERDGPDEAFTMQDEIVAIDTERSTAVVRLEVTYGDGGHWRDLWVIRFAPDGRCEAFEEWPFAPDQPDGH